MMVCLVVYKIDSLSAVVAREYNSFFSYRTATTNYHLVKMVAFFYHVTFLKLPYSFGLYYTFKKNVWYLLHVKHTRVVFSFKNMYE